VDDDVKIFGFWVYLMTDLVIFAVLFAAFVTLHTATFGAPSGRELFHLPFVLAETLLLLTSSFTCALATHALFQQQKTAVILWFAATLLLGLAFLYLEISEFSDFITQDAGPERSAFLSSFFTLVGVHGLHISIGLLWMAISMLHIAYKGLLTSTVSRLIRLAYFWHFLDVVWIFIFTVVYGMELLNA
jgi:cytochrome o ubiquinol oxidase subunit 3